MSGKPILSIAGKENFFLTSTVDLTEGFKIIATLAFTSAS